MSDTEARAENLIYELKDNIAISEFFKGVAIIMVFLTHFHQLYETPVWLYSIFDFLQLGCQIFFVLSAYGLCFSYGQKKSSWTKFMKHRISKLIVGYWSMIFFYIVYRIVYVSLFGLNIADSVNIRGLLANMLFLNGFVPDDFINNHIVSGGWFVGTLVILYMVFPFMHRVYDWNNKNWRKIRFVVFPCVIFIISVILINTANYLIDGFDTENVLVYRSFINQLPVFALGFCLFDIINCGKVLFVKFPALFSIIFAVGSFLCFFSDFKWRVTVYPFLFAAAFVFLFIFVHKHQLLQKRITDGKNKIFNAVNICGRISYFIYLTQSIVLFYIMRNCRDFISIVVKNDVLNFMLFLPVTALMTLVLATLLNKLDKFVRRIK